MAETISDVYRADDLSSPGRRRPALTVVMLAGDPSAPPSRHLLDDIDVVSFARGPRGATRDYIGGRRWLAVSIPDPMMSSDHGRLLRMPDGWMVDDPTSKNGAVIAGRLTRCGVVQVGDVLELGHTVFVLDAVAAAADTAADQQLVPSGPGGAFASFHPEIVAAAEALPAVAASDIPVVFHGETGTGKELFARALHELSGRPGPLVAVNCGALSASLLEAELFGHRRGAFSGATADRPGFVRSADRGTLFLDEIGELSAAGQVALLRVLQEREVVPVGDSTPIAVDIRVCAAGHAPLAREVEAGRFRSDLYARLLGYELRLPALRERHFDLGHLVAQLLARIAPDRRLSLTPRAARALIAYDWPRNVRELERCLATAAVLARSGIIGLEHLPEVVRGAAARGRVASAATTAAPVAAAAPAWDDDDDSDIRRQLAAKLVEHHGNVSAVARDLGKHREQVQRWLRRFGFDPALFRRG